MWSYIRQLVGNGTAATVGIFLFIVVLCLAFCHDARAASGEVDVRGGTSFGTQGYGPVLGLQFKNQLPGFENVNWFAGTLLWGSTRYNNATVENNWDWHGGVEGCRGNWCAGIGATYLQRIDAINGAHTNFMLQLSYKFGGRLSSIDVTHISDAGTTPVNIGRQAALVSIRLQ